MKTTSLLSIMALMTIMPLMNTCRGHHDVNPQVKAAYDVIGRILPEFTGRFDLRLIDPDSGKDVFEVEPAGKRIRISGSTGVAICSGFNYYLRNICHASYNWRCGNNLNIKDLPVNFDRIRKVTPYAYRYTFNYCTFSYSMAFWDWGQWERMIDWMALNGINMPLAPMGQEIIWQRVYRNYGITEDDLKDFFVGQAYNAFGRMGCIDGFGGPLPQSWINNENSLQKKILERERGLGMTPVLQGFTGHIPKALVTKNPGLRYTNLVWLDFPATFLLDWQDPLFEKISVDFIEEQAKEYGTDHFYAIDQFIEMQPASGDTSYLGNMSRSIYSSLDKADPAGKWVLQTWPFRELTFWNNERTRAYFEGVPDDRMIALELMGESWELTGWHKHDGWYGKPWAWCIISNFGDNVSMFGGLPQIISNLEKALESPDKGKLEGMGTMMEGLDYNPVTYQLIYDLMWESKTPDPGEWKKKYLEARYGRLNDTLAAAWDHIFNHYYTQSGQFEVNPVIRRPFMVKEDIRPSEESVRGVEGLLNCVSAYGDVDAYRFDLVNLFRQVFGQYAGHLLYEITQAYEKRNTDRFNEKVEEFRELASKLERLMGTREEFLFGKWIADCRKHASSPEEEALYEWNARAIITTWGGRILYGYAIKDWSGLYSSYYLPKWSILFDAMKTEMTGGKKVNMESLTKELITWEDKWITESDTSCPAVPSGNPLELAKDLWTEYGGLVSGH